MTLYIHMHKMSKFALTEIKQSCLNEQIAFLVVVDVLIQNRSKQKFCTEGKEVCSTFL